MKFTNVFLFLFLNFAVSLLIHSQSYTTISPHNNQILSETPTLLWNQVVEATDYNLEISTTNDFSSKITDTTLESNNFNFTSINLNDNDTYYWRVIAGKNGLAFDTTNVANFSYFDLSSIDSLALWLKADTGVLIENGAAKDWNDQSDSAFVLKMGSTALRAKFVDNAINSYPALYFDDNDQANIPFEISKASYSIFSVYKRVNSQSVNGNIVRGSNGFGFGPRSSGEHSVILGQSSLSGKTIDTAKYVVHSLLVDQDTAYNSVNGILYDDAVFTNSPGGLYFGSGGKIESNIAEVIIFNGKSNVEHELIEHYLLDKYSPKLSLGENRRVCSFPDSISFEDSTIQSILWNTGDTTNKLVVTEQGRYKVTITDNFDRVYTDSIYFILDTFNYAPNFPFADTTICLGDSITVFAGNELYNYNWNTGDTTNFLTIKNDGNYKVSVTSNCNSTILTDSLQININQPAFDLGLDTTICFNGIIDLIPDSNFTNVSYSWSTNETTNSIKADSSSLYKLTVTDLFSCSFSDSILVDIDSSLFELSLGNDTTLCAGNSIEIVQPRIQFDSYLWSTNSIDSAINITESGKYMVTVSKDNCENIDSINISIKGTAPLVDFTFLNQCYLDTLEFTELATDTSGVSLKSWSWSFGDGTSSTLRNPTHVYNSAGLYNVSLIVDNDSSCSGELSENIIIHPKPKALFNTSKLCSDDTIQFNNTSSISSGNIANSFWNFGLNGVDSDTSDFINPNFKFPDTGDYEVTLMVNSNNNCTDTLIRNIAVNPSPIASFTASNFILSDSTSFAHNSSIKKGMINSFVWGFGNGQSSTLQNPKVLYQNKGYFVVSLTVTSDSSCTDLAIDSFKIIDSPPEFRTIIPYNNQFIGETIDFLWKKKDSANQYLFQLSKTNDFSSIDNEKTLFSNSYQLDLEKSDTPYYWRVIAKRNNLAIDTSNVANFSYFDLSSIDSLTLWLKADTGVVIENGAAKDWNDQSDSAFVLKMGSTALRAKFVDNAINSYPALYFDDNDQANIPLTIDNANYSIFAVYNRVNSQSVNGNIVRGSNGFGFGPRSSAEHGVVLGQSSLGGKTIDTSKYVVHSLLVDQDTAYNSVNGTLYDDAVFTNSPGGLYFGSGGKIESNVAEVIIFNGKSNVEHELIENYLLDKYSPKLSLGENRRVCSFPDSISFEDSTIQSILWNTGDTTNKLVVTEQGRYKVTITDNFDRVYTDSIYFILDTFNYAPNFPFADTTICLGDSITVFAGSELYNYNWNTGDTANFLTIKNDGNYKVLVTSCSGNTVLDSVQININQPVFDLGVDTTICFNGIIDLMPDSNFTNVSYSWSTNETTNSIKANSSSLYKLTVTDLFSCSFSDSILVDIDSSLFELSLGNDTTLCAGNSISIQNPNTSINSHLWTGGNTLASQMVDTSGQYKVKVSSLRCSVMDTIGITIKGLAPTADFSTANFCFQDSTKFTDLSTPPSGDNLTSWSWDFDDNTLTNLQNPIHRFNSVKNYKVFLKVETDRGCTDTLTKNITINPKPVVDFKISNSCEKDLIQFNENVSISTGSVTAFFWDFGNSSSPNNLSTQANPTHIYDTLGKYSVELIAESNMGCLDTSKTEKIINPKPVIDISVLNTCLNDSTHLINNTSLSKGNIKDYLWLIDNRSFEVITRDISVLFNSSGSKDVVLRVRTDSMCQSVLRTDITINEKPIANFEANSYCANVPFTIEDRSIAIDPIIDFEYIIPNLDTSSLKNPIFTIDSIGIFNLKQKIKTVNGCIDSITKPFEIENNPIADFTILNNNTGIPFDLKLGNNSQGSYEYLWAFGNGDSSTAFIPEYTYTVIGTYKLKLEVKSEIGCVDSVDKTVTVLPYFLDATLEKINLSETSTGALEISARIINSGSNTIEQIRLTADLNNEFEFTETINEKIFTGEAYGYEFTSSFIQDKGKKVDFICVRIETVNGIKDSIQSNNEICEQAFRNELLLNVYPNPATEFLTLEYVLAEEGTVKIMILDATGKESIIPVSTNSIQGYYISKINISALNPGIYHYSFRQNGILKQGTFIKQ